ncbi:hypothetical protein [Streptomyces rimosus]|uniref:hypothetical protein n=1 Tax=Streptomyces rimosus TaxID=1927 RepID=UPI00311E89EA
MLLVVEGYLAYLSPHLTVVATRLLFADMHASLRCHSALLFIDMMITKVHTCRSGRGILLLLLVFGHKPAPALMGQSLRSLVYPSHGVVMLWAE